MLSFLVAIIQLIIAFILLVILAYAAYWVYFARYNVWAGKPVKRAFCVPLLGNAIGILSKQNIFNIDKDLYTKYGRLFGTYTANIPTLYVADPDLLKVIFVKDFHVFHSRRDFKTGNPLIDNALSILKGGDQWRNIRNTMTPTFTTGKLKKMMPLIRECAQQTVDNFEKHSADGCPVDFKSLFGCFALDVIANVAFGTKIDSHNDPNNLFILHAKKVFSFELSWKAIVGVLLPKVGKLIGATLFPDDTLDFFKNTVETIVARRKENNEKRHDFLQLMMDSMEVEADSQEYSENSKKPDTTELSETPVDSVENIKRKPLTNIEFLAQTITFFFAAYDTTGTALTAACYFFALNPDCQKKAADEVDRIWSKYDSIDTEALYEAKYLGAAIDESFRLCPPGGRIERSCSKDYELGDTGLIIPKGVLVTIPVPAIHTDPEFYPEPEKFKPERFLDEEKNNRNPYTYLPFGAGPRQCIAMRLALLEVRLCLLYLLRNFEMSPSAQTTIPLQFKNSVLIQPKGVILHVTKRVH